MKKITAFLLAGLLCFSLVGTALALTLEDDIPDGSTVEIGKDQNGNPVYGIEGDQPGTPTTPGTNPGGDVNPPPVTNPSYTVNGAEGTAENGSWTSDKTSAKKGDTVTITTTPKDGYEAVVTVKDSKGNEVEVKDLGEGKFSYVMPDGAVTVSVTFKTKAPVNPFTDVADDVYYYDAVLWAVEKGITTGKTDTSFAPGDPCTRAQIVTFLWRAYGEPEPTGDASQFTDVDSDAYYAKAVAWAVENGITTGKTATSFAPGDPCTRAQAVTFQFRAAKAEAVGSSNSFTDVASDAYYAEAVDWAVANGITNGTNTAGTLFSPSNTCNRAQIVTFLYRELGEK